MRCTATKAAAIASFFLAGSGPAWATCAPSAPTPALQAFLADPAGWIGSYGKAQDLGSVATVLAAAAVNAKDAQFGKALGTMLGAASSDQGRIIGHALSGLAETCSDPKDPADVADKKYISLNILPNLLSNLSANVAYGQGTGPESTSTGGGGGGGGGGGNGLVGSGLPEGAANGGSSPNETTATATAGDPISSLNAGSVGATQLTQALASQITPATLLTTPGGAASGSVSPNQ